MNRFGKKGLGVGNLLGLGHARKNGDQAPHSKETEEDEAGIRTSYSSQTG
jgi:hypothetical protein